MTKDDIKKIYPGSLIDESAQTILVKPHGLFSVNFKVKQAWEFSDKTDYVYVFYLKCNGDPDYRFINGEYNYTLSVYDKNEICEIVLSLTRMYCEKHQIEGYEITINEEELRSFFDLNWDKFDS